MRVSIVHPSPQGVTTGNRVTALRWAKLLRELGHDVRVRTKLDDAPVDVLIALNARKCAQAVVECRTRHPRAKRVTAVTGTDLYEPLSGLPAAETSLETSHAIVALAPHALERLPLHLRARARVILQSAPT